MFNFLKKLFSSPPRAAKRIPAGSQRQNRGKTFLLEPILTPSGLPLDLGDETSDFDQQDDLSHTVSHYVDAENRAEDAIALEPTSQHDFSHITAHNTTLDLHSVDLDTLEEIPFFDANGNPDLIADSALNSDIGDILEGRDVVYNVPTVPETHLDFFTSGIFTVGDTGEVEIDYLWDGGKFQGQLAFFNLQGIDRYEPGSQEFILEALHRVLDTHSDTTSPLGHIIIDDLSEGARFSGNVGEGDFNSGTYSNIKTFNLQPGTHWGAMLIPNGTAEEVWNILNDPNATLPKNLRPLFSLATANPNDGLQLGQIADVMGDKHTFVFEDLRTDGWTDKDYNDIIFQIKGASGEAINLDEVINPANDWRNTEIGQTLIDYITPDTPSLPTDPITGTEYIPNELLVKFDAGLSDTEIANLATEYGATGIERIIPETSPADSPLHQWRLFIFDSATNVINVRDNILDDLGVETSELNGVRSLEWEPNDTEFPYQWGLHNTGAEGSLDADIDAPEAWDVQRGSRDVTVAIIDTGVDYNHEDLNANMWRNPGEIAGDGIDNDGNGYVDDIYGYDFGNSDSNPLPDKLPPRDIEYGHGTHVAGIIGAVGDNDKGIVGVSPNVSLMALNARNNEIGYKYARSGLTFEALAKSINYAIDNEANIINASFGGLEGSQIELDAINYANQRGVLFVASAGNKGENTDVVSHYPSNYNLPNIISVAATDRDDKLWEDSNYGVNTVDLGAPGDGIKSTVPGNDYDGGSGTSMAAAQVAGAAALLLAQNPNLSPTELKKVLIETSDKNRSLESKTSSGRRLNLSNLLNLDWIEKFGTDGVDTAEHIVIDSEDSIYVSGTTTGSLGREIEGGQETWVAKFNRDGKREWIKQWNINWWNHSDALAIDNNDNLFVLSHAADRPRLDKYTKDGALVWSLYDDFYLLMDDSLGRAVDQQIGGGDIATDSEGNVYVAGTGHGMGMSAFLSKYDPDGNRLWTSPYPTISGESHQSRSVTVDKFGNVYVAGNAEKLSDSNNVGSAYIWFAKYGSDGTLLWKSKLDTPLVDRIWEIKVDERQQLYAAFSLNDPSTGNTIVGWQNFDVSGDIFIPQAWELPTGDSGYNRISDLIFDERGGIYFSLSSNIHKFNTAQELQWRQVLGTLGNTVVEGIAIDSKGNVYGTGSTKENLGGEIIGEEGSDIWIAKLKLS